MSGPENKYELYPLGETAIVVDFSGAYKSGDAGSRIRTLCHILDEVPFEGFVECVPAYATVTVYYNPMCIRPGLQEMMPFERVCEILRDRMVCMGESPAHTGRIAEIPVCYETEFGPDLQAVADYNGLTARETVHIHSSEVYQVAMLGFAPGFPYLSGMSQRIATPRRSVPRLGVPAGSVGIGGGQTGIYPLETPGGWNIIGRTPLPLFRPNERPPTLLRAGDELRFVPINRAEFIRILQQDERSLERP